MYPVDIRSKQVRMRSETRKNNESRSVSPISGAAGPTSRVQPERRAAPVVVGASALCKCNPQLNALTPTNPFNGDARQRCASDLLQRRRPDSPLFTNWNGVNAKASDRAAVATFLTLCSRKRRVRTEKKVSAAERYSARHRSWNNICKANRNTRDRCRLFSTAFFVRVLASQARKGSNTFADSLSHSG